VTTATHVLLRERFDDLFAAPARRA